jgi:hypothetical protein
MYSETLCSKEHTDVKVVFFTKHCYVICAGRSQSRGDTEENNENVCKING